MSAPRATRIALDFWEREGVWIATDREREVRASGDARREALGRLDRFIGVVDEEPDSPEAESIRRASKNLETAYERDCASDVVDEAVEWARTT